MVDPRSSGGNASAGNIVEGGQDPSRLEPAVWAYCRELCGPTAGEQAATATLLAFGDGNGSSIASQDEVLRITRKSAAEHAPTGANGRGWMGKSSANCTATPGLLVGRANDELTATQLRRLAEHVQDCLVCKATGLKMKRAERVFAVMQGAQTSSRARSDATEPATVVVPRASPLEAGLDPNRARSAVQAYCRELCGPACEPAVEATLAAHEKHSASGPASGSELLRTTRQIAAKHASARSDGPKRSRACAPTLGRLAARATGELTRSDGRNLEAHLASCMACQATELRMSRAERAYAAMVGLGVGIERFETAEPRSAPVEPIDWQSAPVEPPVEPIDWQSAPVEPPVEPINGRSAPVEPPTPIEPIDWRSAPVEPIIPIEPAPAPVDWESSPIEPIFPIEPTPDPVEPPLEPSARPSDSIVWPRRGATDAELAAAAVAAAGAAGYEARPRSGKPPGQRRAGRSQPRRARPVLLAGLAMLIAVAAALAVLKLASTSSHKPTVHAVVTHGTPPTGSHAATAKHAAQHKPKPKPKAVVHRHRAKAHKAAAKAHKTVKPKQQVAVVPVTHRAVPAAPRRVVAAPVVRRAPVVAKPRTTAPSVTPPTSSLPAANAPVQGISP